jgi:serine/threonine-protein kinase
MTDVDLANHPTFAQRHLGPYHIEEEIGAGSMGTVFRAIHTGLDRPVALKVLRPDMLQDADSVRRFLREARSSARLEHPHIVSVYDAGEIDGQYYIAMKLLEGQTLQGLLAGGPLRPDRVVKLGTQLASALDYAHGREVVHLDV